MTETAAAARSLGAELKTRIRTRLPEGAFLHCSRKGGLFATDAPRYADWQNVRDKMVSDGFSVEEAAGIALISPGGEVVSAFEADFPQPPDAFSASLLRFSGQAAEMEATDLFARGLKFILMDESREAERYDKSIRQLAARQMRLGACGGLYGCALMRLALIKSHESPCKSTKGDDPL